MLPRSLCAPFQSLQPLPDLQAWPPMCFFLITWFGFSHSTLCLQLCHSHCCRVFIVWRYNLFIHFTVHGHLSHFYFVAITYRAAVGHLSHIFWSAYGLTQCLAFFFPFLKRFIFYFWLWWVFTTACGPSLVAESGVYSAVVVRWLLLLWITGSRARGLCSCSSWALEQQAE